MELEDFCEFFEFEDLTSGEIFKLSRDTEEDGLTWVEAVEKEWCTKSAAYDFSDIETDLFSCEEIKKAVEKRDYLLATRIAIHNEEHPFSVALELDSEILLASLIFYYKHNGGIRRYETYDSDYDLGDHFEYEIWEYINDKAVLAKAVEHNAHKCFLTLLLLCNDLDLANCTQLVFLKTGEKIIKKYYRPYDWLLTDKYFDIGINGGFLDFDDPFVYYREDWKIDLLASLVLESRLDEASKLLKLGWHSLNPPVWDSDGSPTLLNEAIESAKAGNVTPLKWCTRVMQGHSKFALEVISCLEYEEEIKGLLEDQKNLFDMYDVKESVEMYIFEMPLFEILRNHHALSKLHEASFKKHVHQQEKNKLISVFDDMKRVFPDLLSDYVSDLTVYFQDDKYLVVSLYEYGEKSPALRAIVDAYELSTFYRPLSICHCEGHHMTDFQIQLAFLSLSSEEIVKSILERMMPVGDKEESMAYAVNFIN